LHLVGHLYYLPTAVLWLVMKWEHMYKFPAVGNTFSLYQSSRTLYLLNCFQETFEHLVALALQINHHAPNKALNITERFGLSQPSWYISTEINHLDRIRIYRGEKWVEPNQK